MSFLVSLFFVISSLVSTPALAVPAKKCFTFRGGNQEVTIGWFARKTFTVQSLCLQGVYNKMGFNTVTMVLTEAGFSAGRTGADITYKASIERFSATQARFTISDGEPEPTQWEASFNGSELVSIDFERQKSTQLVPVR